MKSVLKLDPRPKQINPSQWKCLIASVEHHVEDEDIRSMCCHMAGLVGEGLSFVVPVC